MNLSGKSGWDLLPPSITHEEIYCASNGEQWRIYIEVRWCPQYSSEVLLFKLPDNTPVALPSYLPYREVVAREAREAAVDGCFDLVAISRFYIGRCVDTLRQYIERFGSEL